MWQLHRGQIAGRRALDAAAAGGATTTWNPSDKAANVTLSNGNLTATNAANGNNNVRSIASYSTGKYYAEFTMSASNTNAYARGIGVANSTESLTGGGGGANSGILYQGDALFYRNSGSATTGLTYGVNDVVSMAVDLTNNTIWYRLNGGNWNNNVANDPATNTGGLTIPANPTRPLFVFCNLSNIAPFPAMTANFGATAYSFTPPSGFGNW